MMTSRQHEKPAPRAHSLKCPECESPMRLRESRFGLFYGCTQFPDCKGTHGAHPNGAPLGIPADQETKLWRVRAHKEFDKLWKGPGSSMSRSAAYQWMIDTLEMSPDEAHIGRFSSVQCQRLLAVLAQRTTFEQLNGPQLSKEEVAWRREQKRQRKRGKSKPTYRGGR